MILLGPDAHLRMELLMLFKWVDFAERVPIAIVSLYYKASGDQLVINLKERSAKLYLSDGTIKWFPSYKDALRKYAGPTYNGW